MIDDYGAFRDAHDAWTRRAWAALVFALARAHVRLDTATILTPVWRYDGVLMVASIAVPHGEARTFTLFCAPADLLRLSDLDIAEADLLLHAASEPPPSWDEPAFLGWPDKS